MKNKLLLLLIVQISATLYQAKHTEQRELNSQTTHKGEQFNKNKSEKLLNAKKQNRGLFQGDIGDHIDTRVGVVAGQMDRMLGDVDGMVDTKVRKALDIYTTRQLSVVLKFKINQLYIIFIFFHFFRIQFYEYLWSF